ncbi:MAG: hypothetical protein IKU02_09135 [Bacteroidaceae bacterium]|nr:hypothetical protein [Bacteroidaceae bacterium]
MEEEIKTTGMVVDETMKADLLSSAKWAKFLLVLYAIGLVILFAVGIAMIVLGEKFGACFPGAPQAGPVPPCAGNVGLFIGIFYLVLGLIMLYPLVKGFQFANNTKAACLTGSEEKLARGFAGMRSYLKFYGILAIIALIIYAIIAILGVIGFAAMHGSCPA